MSRKSSIPSVSYDSGLVQRNFISQNSKPSLAGCSIFSREHQRTQGCSVKRRSCHHFAMLCRKEGLAVTLKELGVLRRSGFSDLFGSCAEADKKMEIDRWSQGKKKKQRYSPWASHMSTLSAMSCTAVYLCMAGMTKSIWLDMIQPRSPGSNPVSLHQSAGANWKRMKCEQN